MNVAIVHNAIAAGETDPSTLDVLDQARHVAASLAAAGHRGELLPFDDDLAAFLPRLRAMKADVVFSLVEEVRGSAALHPWAAGLWEILGLPWTGNTAAALALTTDKRLTKLLLRGAGIATPAWADDPAGALACVPPPWILKPACEDASVGIDEDSVVRDPKALPSRFGQARRRFAGAAILIEQYVDGREFNVSVVGEGGEPRVLPPAEILFDAYPAGKERVVGFRAKWDPQSFEFHHTPRRFDFPAADAPLLDRLRETSAACWRLFGLSGYARIDLRVDAAGQVCVIEANANPCLSPDAGFAAAAARAGLSPQDVVTLILKEAVCRST